MAAVAATTEIDPVNAYSLGGEHVSLFYPYSFIVPNLVKTATRSEIFPSLVEIIWYGSEFTFDEAQSKFGITNVFSPMTFSSAPFPPNYDMLSISPAPIENAPSGDCGVQITEPMHSSLSRKIREVYEHTQFDEDAAELARRAVNDAIKFVEFSLPGGSPLVMLSDDGVLSIQWRCKNSGIMLVFTGDGAGTYSIKQPGGSYAVGAKDFSLDDGLADEVKAAIDAQAAG